MVQWLVCRFGALVLLAGCAVPPAQTTSAVTVSDCRQGGTDSDGIFRFEIPEVRSVREYRQSFHPGYSQTITPNTGRFLIVHVVVTNLTNNPVKFSHSWDYGNVVTRDIVAVATGNVVFNPRYDLDLTSLGAMSGSLNPRIPSKMIIGFDVPDNSYNLRFRRTGVVNVGGPFSFSNLVRSNSVIFECQLRP